MNLDVSSIIVTQLKGYPLIKDFDGVRYDFGNFYGFDIVNSIPYQALLKNDFRVYADYVLKTGQKEHSASGFKQLYNEFRVDRMQKIELLYWEQIDQFSVVDGVHRLAVLLHKKLISKEISLAYLNIHYPRPSIEHLLAMLRKTTQEVKYNGWRNTAAVPAGYHSFSFGNINLQGQRDAVARLNGFRAHCNFRGKRVVDFGCNTGGMLLHLYEISEGCGLDYDQDCIDAARYVNQLQHVSPRKLTFSACDLISDEIEAIQAQISFKPDIFFLLSLGSWIKNWERLYAACCDYAPDQLFLEINNVTEGVAQLEFFKSRSFDVKEIMPESVDDCTGNRGRKTYLIQKTHKSVR